MNHFPQFLVVKYAGLSSKNVLHYKQDFSKFSEGNLLNDFENLDLAFLNDVCLDVNTKFN